MKIKGNCLNKNKVEFCTEEFTLNEALEKLYSTGYRCIPVLDKKGKKFLGNVYKVHILEYEKEHGHLNGSIVEILKNQKGYIYQETSFFEIFFSIKELPYITVLDEKDNFIGILTHKKVFEILEDSWGVNTGSYSLTISIYEYNGALQKLVSIVNKFSTIKSLITLDSESSFIRRVELTLPKGVSLEALDRIKSKLDKNGFRVIDVEEL